MFFNDRSLGMEDIFTPHFVLNYPLFVQSRHLSRHWSWWFRHREYALHQFGNFSTISRDLPIVLLQGHETALSLWSPSPSKKNSSITARGQRLAALYLWWYHLMTGIRHTCRHFFFGILLLCCPISSGFRGAKQQCLLPPVMTHDPWYVWLYAASLGNTLFGAHLKNLWGRRGTISEAIKQSSDWDHPTNPPYLFSKLSPNRQGPLVLVFTKSDGDAPSPPKDVKLQVPMSSQQATDLFFSALMIGTEITCTRPWPLLGGPVLPTPHRLARSTSLLGIVNDSVAVTRVPLVQSVRDVYRMY